MRKASPTSLLFFCLLLSLLPQTLEAQGARVRQANAAANRVERIDQNDQERDSDADNPEGRQDWFRSGRRAAGEHAADLLRRAYGNKRQMTVNSVGASAQSATTFSVASPIST